MALLLCGHEIAPALIDYRKNDKEESTYANALLGSVAPDGAIHPTFWQNVQARIVLAVLTRTFNSRNVLNLDRSTASARASSRAKD
jgi:hypothetical protein